jgi:hypothetical protein
MKRTSLAALAALVLLLLGAAEAGASVQRSISPFSFAATGPCNGETGTLSGIETAGTLVSATDNHFLYESTIRTDETFTADDPAEPSASGHGTFHVTFVANAAGDDPSSGTTVYTELQSDVFHAPGVTVVVKHTVHTTVVDGKLIVSIDRPVLVCRGL